MGYPLFFRGKSVPTSAVKGGKKKGKRETLTFAAVKKGEGLRLLP